MPASNTVGAGRPQRFDDLLQVGACGLDRKSRKPSLPPNSTIVTRGLYASTSPIRATPSVVVLPLTPALTTRQCNPGPIQVLLYEIGKTLAWIGAVPGAKLSPNATITGRVSICWTAMAVQAGLQPSN